MTGPNDLSEIEAEFARLAEANPVMHGATIDCDQVGNARRLAFYYGKDLRFSTQNDQWYAWSGSHWRAANESQILEYAIRVHDKMREESEYVPDHRRDAHTAWTLRSRTFGALRASVEIAKALPELWIDKTMLDRNPFLFNSQTCTINLSPGAYTCTPFQRGDFITRCSPTPYDPNATSNLLDDFLDKFLPDPEERTYLLTTFAIAALQGGNTSRMLLMLMGPSSTGKSTLIELLRETLGQDYLATINASVFRGNLDDRARPDLLTALGARIVIAHEASDNWELHADQIKRMTGQDPIPARGMRSNVIEERVAEFVPCIVANDTPRVKGADAALRRRLRVVVMDQAVDPSADDGMMRFRLIRDAQVRRAMLALLVRLYSAAGGVQPNNPPLRFVERTQLIFAELDDVDEVMQSLVQDGSLIHKSDASAAMCISTGDLYVMYARRSRVLSGHSSASSTMGKKAFTQRLLSLGMELCRSNGSRVVGLIPGQNNVWADIVR